MAEQDDDRAAGMQYLAIGIEFGTTIGLSVVAGYYLDRYFGSQPILTLLLTFASMFGALRRLIWSLNRHRSR